MAIRSGPNVGIVSTWLAANTMPNPMPTPVRASRMGSPIATTDPNATSMMMTAAVMPIPSLAPGAAVITFSAGVPPTATFRPGRAKRRAELITSFVAAPGSFASVVSNLTSTNPVRPSGESWPRTPEARGLVTDDTCGSGRSADASLEIVAAFWPPVSDCGECITTSTVAPASAGKRAVSRFCACCAGRASEA